jgi:hypothetical protein
MRYIKIFILMLMIVSSVSAAAKIKTGEDLIKEMHKKYSGKWYI